MSFVVQVCVETQRFEKLMEYFKNEDNNIDFMVGSHAHLNTHSPNGLLIALQSLENPTSPCKLQMVWRFSSLLLSDV